MPLALTVSQHIGIGIVHIDPPHFDDGINLLSGGFRWSDLKGINQIITHWMYVDEPYDESEETLDAVLLHDQDGNIKKSSEHMGSHITDNTVDDGQIPKEDNNENM